MENNKLGNENKKGFREFFLSTFSVNNSMSIFILTLMIFIFGFQAYNSMPKELFPEVSIPTVFVTTAYMGNSAVDMENLVTRPLEQELQSVEGIKDMKSSSQQDYSIIIIEFESGIDINEGMRKIKDAIDLAEDELPDDLDMEPQVKDINLSELPIMTVNLSGDYGMDELNSFAEYLEDEIETIDEVSEAQIKGASEREVKIDIDLFKMQTLELGFNDIIMAIAEENITMSGGEILQDGFRRAVRIIGEFSDVEEIANLIVKSEDQNPVYLKDIADVSFGFKEQTSIARADGYPVVSVDVMKRQGKNVLSVSDQIKEIVAKAEAEVFPSDLSVSLFNDQSVNTRREVDNLENSIISGIILVVLVLLFFLGLRNALFVGIAIPLSMLMGFLLLNLFGITLNMVVLFSLILALGMLVDNGIVVVENIYRFRTEGFKSTESSKYGAGEVAVPIIAATATTVSAFIPLAFWPGLIGHFMLYLPITLIAVMTSSLLVALVINPVLTAAFMKIDKRDKGDEWKRKRNRNLYMASGFMLMAILGLIIQNEAVRNIGVLVTVLILLHFFVLRPFSFTFQERFMPWLEGVYFRFAKFVLKGKRSIVVFVGTVLLLFLAIGLVVIRTPDIEFFPSTDPQYINVFVEMPLGTDIAETDKVVRVLESRIDEVIQSKAQVVEAVLVQIGENTSDPNGPPQPGTTPNKARITVSFVPFSERNGISTKEIMEEVRRNVQGLPGVSVIVDQNESGPPTGRPINLELQGSDISNLAQLSEDVMNYLEEKKIPGIEKLQKDVQIGKPELVIHINREASRRYGLSTEQIAGSIRTSIFGYNASYFKVGEDKYDIYIRLSEKYRYNEADLLNQMVTFRDNMGQLNQVPISAVAELEYSSTYSSVERLNRERVITIYSNVLEGYNANQIVDALKENMENYRMPVGYTYKFTGEQEEQADAMEFLSSALMIALFFIFLIIVLQFNSIFSPLIIMGTVVLSTIGVFLGLFFTGSNIVIVMTGVGIISLAGIVVNNAIVLIDYIELLIKRKREEYGLPDGTLPYNMVKEAIIEGGARRLRPVLLTAITTILGLIPLAIGLNIDFAGLITNTNPNFFIGGESADFWKSMAWTVIYGLTFATFLTLIVVPVMYWLTYRMKYRVKAKLGQDAPENYDYSKHNM